MKSYSAKLSVLAFQQRRKTLRNGIRAYAEHLIGVEEVVDLSRRAEDLSVANFVALSNYINQSILSKK